MTDKQAQLEGLKVVIYSQLLTETMDNLRKTSLFKGKVKQYGSILSNLLLSIIKQTDEVYDENPTLTTNILNEVDKLTSKLAKCDFRELVMINQIHEHYKNNQSDWDNVFNVELTELNT